MYKPNFTINVPICIFITITVILCQSAYSNDAINDKVLIFYSSDQAVNMAVMKDNRIYVSRLSEKNQIVNYISVTPNGKSVWLIYDKNAALKVQQKYGPLDVYIINGDILSIQHYSCSIDLSPVGDKLAYITKSHGIKQLCYMDLKTSEVKVLSDTWGYYQRPKWSPDGTKIAYFYSTDINGYKLHVIDTTSGRDIELSQSTLAMNLNGNFMDEIIWSADGKHIFYSSQYESDGVIPFGIPATYVVPSDGSKHPERIATGKIISISSDGNILNISGKGFDIRNNDVKPVPLPLTIADGSYPSPDNKIIAFRKKWFPGSTSAESKCLWFKTLSDGSEVKISDKWWDESGYDWAMKWVSVPASE